MDIQHLGRVGYEEAWELQQKLHARRLEGVIDNTVLLLEHPSVYTAGKRTRDKERPQDGTPVVEVNRGGKITWHGPGQLVGYPIVDLKRPLDVVEYVRCLERVLMDAVAELGVHTVQISDRTGVWVPADHRGGERKIAAIGVRVRYGVTLHGFALNCNPDLAAFENIVPCGIDDATVSSLSAELGRSISLDAARPIVERQLHAHLPQILRNTIRA